ncbi:hypothetical protein A6U87_06080 [Rhizobium sp. AC44/96]|nr:hypothetical protein A6U87_06080 [Rhizobium sp. AC44/96]
MQVGGGCIQSIGLISFHTGMEWRFLDMAQIAEPCQLKRFSTAPSLPGAPQAFALLDASFKDIFEIGQLCESATTSEPMQNSSDLVS